MTRLGMRREEFDEGMKTQAGRGDNINPQFFKPKGTQSFHP